jgi:hypothetical protein
LPTGIYVIGGRTRLYAALALGVPANVKIISANNFKQGVAEGSLEDRLKKYVRPVVKTTPKIERTTNPAGRTTDHVEWKVTGPMGDVTRFSSKKAAQAHYDSFGKSGLGKGVEESVEFMSDAQFYGEILSVLAALGAGLATGAYLKVKDIVKMYNANQIMRALEGHRVSNISDSERRTLTNLLAEFKQAMANRQGKDALAIAKRIKSIATDQPGVAENQGWAATLETVSANGTIANTSGAGAGMTASYQRRDNQPIAEDYLSERRL